jgi:hypothetical protein
MQEESGQKIAGTSVDVDDGYVAFWPAGTHAKGCFRCAACGGAVTVLQVLPSCNVCGERLWERAAWSPFAQPAD